jgi:hypothetical protein
VAAPQLDRIEAAPLDGGRPLSALRRHWIMLRRASRGW